jgi:hypothetical protein
MNQQHNSDTRAGASQRLDEPNAYAALSKIVFADQPLATVDDGFGPCLDAAVSGQTIKLTMDDPDTPYPDFCTTAQRQGVTHTISVGLPVATRSVGALKSWGTSTAPATRRSRS